MEGNEMKASIIKAINSPLGFFALSLLTVEGFLGIVLIYSGLDEKNKYIGMLLGTGMFVLVVLVVTFLVVFKPKNLTFSEESHLIDEGKNFGQKGYTLLKEDLKKEPKSKVSSEASPEQENLI